MVATRARRTSRAVSGSLGQIFSGLFDAVLILLALKHVQTYAPKPRLQRLRSLALCNQNTVLDQSEEHQTDRRQADDQPCDLLGHG